MEVFTPDEDDVSFDDDEQANDGTLKVEILGMSLLSLDDRDEDSNDIDDATNDVVCGKFKSAVDSLKLARDAHEKLVTEGSCTRAGGRKMRRKGVSFLSGEVDSLILTREREPHIVHDSSTDKQLLSAHLFREGRGLMGEVDSLILDKKRLSHVRHKRKEPYAHPCISWKRIPRQNPKKPQDYEVPLNDLKRPEAISISSNDSDNSDIDTLFTSDTVDSLILTRRRLYSHPTRKELGRVGAPHISSKSSPKSLPPKMSHEPKLRICLGSQHASSSSSARAA